MEDKSQLIVVDANILPDVFTKVLEVKKLMATVIATATGFIC